MITLKFGISGPIFICPKGRYMRPVSKVCAPPTGDKDHKKGRLLLTSGSARWSIATMPWSAKWMPSWSATSSFRPGNTFFCDPIFRPESLASSSENAGRTRSSTWTKLLDLAGKHSKLVMATCSWRHFDQANIAVRRQKRGRPGFATAEIPDEPHFHIPVYLMTSGYDVESISMNTDDVQKTGYFNVDYFYPAADKRKPFVLSMLGAGTDLFSFNILCKQYNVASSIPAGSDSFSRFFGQLMDNCENILKNARCISQWK